ncbi:hypothetical protein IPM19_02750 [bacterium]|nr:MAG: hypothetical protein IPM19_02750 [bacterium]
MGLVFALYFLINTEDSAQLSESLAIGVQESSDGSLYYFDRQELAYFKKTTQGEDLVFELGYEPYSMIYSPERDKVLAIGSTKYPGQAIDLIDLVTKKKKTLDLRIINAAFSPDGSQVAYHFYDPKLGESAIYVSDANFTESYKSFVVSLDYAENLFYILRWHEIENLYLLPMQSDDYNVELLRINLAQKKLETVANGTFLDFLPTNDSNKLLIHGSSNNSNESQENSGHALSVFNLKTKRTVKTNLIVDSLTNISFSKNDSLIYVIGTQNEKFGLHSLDLNGKTAFVKDIDTKIKGYILEVVYNAKLKSLFISTESDFIQISL